MKNKVVVKTVIALMLLAAIAMNIAGCAKKAYASELTQNVTASAVTGKAIDAKFCDAQRRLAVDMINTASDADKNTNVLVSPLSAMLALAMAANGAQNDTLSEIEQLLGGMKTDELNEYVYSFMSGLSSTDETKFKYANSIWLLDDTLDVKSNYLQKIKDYYQAQVFRCKPGNAAVDEMNSWVNENTDGMIKKIVDKISNDTVLMLMNTLAFDGEWSQPYMSDNVSREVFTAYDNSLHTVDMMLSSENMYLEDTDAKGFVKRYKGGKFSFAVLLPNRGIDINEYISSLDGAKLGGLLNGAEYANVVAKIPKFECDYTIVMNDMLKSLGMEKAFTDQADFTGIAGIPLRISEVIQKTYINVDEHGTKASAATLIKGETKSAAPDEPKSVICDRPFIYMIIDNDSNIPLFIGTVKNF